jgi:alpha-1,6-mannosyltransferase
MITRLLRSMTQPAVALISIALALTAAATFGPALHQAFGGIVWHGLIFFWAVLAFVATRIAGRMAPSMALAIILVSAALMRLPLLLEPPYLSTDAYRYVWDGRVQGAGINPYLHLPAAPEVAHLRDAAIYPHINRADYAPTIYPPAAQMAFWLITRISDGILAMKLGGVAFELMAVIATIGLLRSAGLPTTNVVAFAWHPLPVWEIAGNAHVDAVLIGLMTASLWVFVSGRTMVAGAIASVAVFVKPAALLLMPVFWRPWNWKLPALLVGIGLALYAPYLSAGRKVLGYLGGYVAEEELSTGGGFRYLGLIQKITGPITHGNVLYVLVSGTILAGLALQVGFRSDRSPDSAIRSFALLLTAFLVLLTPHYPWYYLALAPLLALRRTLTPWVLMTGGFLLYDVIPDDRLPAFAWREGGLHLAALAALAFDAFRSRDSSLTLSGDSRK